MYEASTLLQAAKDRIGAYKKLEEQILQLQQTFNGIADLGDDFKGKGADNIKSFYKGHASVADQWLNLIRTQIAFFESIPMQVKSGNLEGQTVVNEAVLEMDVATGLRQSEQMVKEQKAALTNIFANIQDIMDLKAFSTDTFDASLEQADKERKDTMEAVETLDETLVADYSKLDVYYQAVLSNQQALMNATSSGGSVSPLYFEEKAYHRSEAYQLQGQTNKLAQAYVEQKETKRKAYEERINATKPFDFTEVCENPEAEKDEPGIVIGAKNIGEDLASIGKGTVSGLKGVGEDVWNGMENRADKWNDSWYDFGNYMTMGAFDGAVSFKDGLNDRANRMFDSKYDFFNYTSVGLLDVANGALNPEDPLSKEHWENSIGLFTTFLGGVKPVGVAKNTAKIAEIKTSTKSLTTQTPLRPAKPAFSLIDRWKRILSTSVVKQNDFAFAGVPNEMISDIPEVTNKAGTVKFSNIDSYGSSPRKSDSTIRSVDDAHAWGETHYSEWMNWLTDQEKQGIIDYTGDDYAPINRYLREITDSLDGVDSRTISAIYNGLSKAELPHDVTVYRGTGIEPIEHILNRSLSGEIMDVENLAGHTVQEKGFMSTSVLKGSSFDKSVSWTINAPKGSQGAYVGKISHFPYEAELLFNMKQEMLIKKASLDEDGKIHLILELMNN